NPRSPQAGVLRPGDADKLRTALNTGVFEAYISELEALRPKCVNAQTNTRRLCTPPQQPEGIDRVPKGELRPELHYELRVRGQEPTILPERRANRLLFGTIAFNVDMGLTGAPRDPRDNLSRKVVEEAKVSGPVDVVLIVRGRYVEDYRLRFIGKGY